MSEYLIHKACEPKNLNRAMRTFLDKNPGHLESFYIAQPKHDGCNAILHWNGAEMSVQSRTGEPVVALDHLVSFIKFLNLPPGYYLGEAWHPNLKFPEISGTFRRKRLDVEKDLLQLVVFDYLTETEWEAGESHMPYADRVENMGAPFLAVPHTMRNAPMYPISGFGKIAERWPAATGQDIANKLVAAGGYDGLIFRDPHGTWSANDSGKNGEIIKIKPLLRVSCRVVDFEFGKGKYEGKVGTLVVEYKGKRQGAGTGLKDKDRELGVYEQKWDKKIVEIEALGETEDGFLREPRLLGIRTDVVDPD